ncbi:MAG TPA: TrkA family potassium uptake protein [Candidatus Gemmiger excrementigallinarum]|uniref:TrkA family potassium uptake protein n=1 Tax=Candidatus Gemmiger excrementigallinarum TaxID=2838609 RepID=A0A9D2EQ31_9FIRM|nr:TrkA family potassium uptake protein [Candidatus Gemmiger excrementigallinarum]
MKKQDPSTLYGVIGLGRFGTALVKTLAAAGKEVIAIDKNEEKVREVRAYTDYAFVVDNLSETALKETGMQNCGTVTVCIGEQIDMSILTTMLVIKLGVPNVIAKATSEVHGEVLKRMGATVVYPEADMAVRIGRRLIFGNLLDYVALADGVEVRRITAGGRVIGRTVQELDVRKVYGINIIAVERDGRTDVEFTASYRFGQGDTITVIGKVDKIDRFERDLQD